jgi:hypothetical protein
MLATKHNAGHYDFTELGCFKGDILLYLEIIRRPDRKLLGTCRMVLEPGSSGILQY